MARQSYEEAIREARARYRQNMDETAADVLLIVQVHRKARATVCKDIAGEDGWNALEIRTRKLEKTAGQTADELRRTVQTENRKRAERHVRQLAQADPAFVVEAVKKVAPRAFAEALEPEALAPVSGKSRQAIENQAPGELLLSEFYGWYIRGKALMGLAQESGKLNAKGREDLEETAELARTLIDFVVTIATSGNVDEELEKLLEGSA